jgi:lipopolysaccharide export system ATP-binding protein
MQNSLAIDSVVKLFGSRKILSDIYLKGETGDIIGILGRNGCGKSTLLKIMFGTIGSFSKSIRFNGELIDQPFKTTGLVGYLPQHHFLLPHLSVYQIVKLYLDADQISPFLTDAVIGHLQNSKISTLSGGELRYLEIKLILNTPNKFILLDEPFNGVAPVVVDRLKIMIREQSKTKGIILTDHDYNNVMDVANRYCLIHEGSMKQVNSHSDLINWNYLTENSLV